MTEKSWAEHEVEIVLNNLKNYIKKCENNNG